jgi:hypothetical protein
MELLETGASTMRFKTKMFAVLAALLASSLVPSNAQEPATNIVVAAAQSAKQQCLNLCRTRYRDCLSRKQIPSSECRGVYQDCSRIACTNLRT